MLKNPRDKDGEPSSARDPSGRQRWWQAVTMLLLTVGYAGYYLCRANLSVATPSLRDELVKTTGMTSEEAAIQIGGFVSLGTLAYGFGKFFAGGLGDFLGGRINFLLGMSGAIGFTCLFASGSGIPTWSMAWIGNRLVQSLGWPGVVRVSTRWFSYSTYGGVMAIISLSFLFGDALAKLFMGRVLQAGLSWRQMYYLDAVILGVILIVNVIWLRESPGSRGLEEPKARTDGLLGESTSSTDRISAWKLLLALMRSPSLAAICVMSIGMTFLREVFSNWSSVYFVDVLSMTKAEAAEASAMFPLFGGISVLASGFLSDRLGRGGRALLILLGLIASGLVLFLLSMIPASMGRAVPVALISSLAFVLIGPYAFLGGAIAMDLGGKQASASVGGLIDGLGYLIGGVVAGQGVAYLQAKFGWSGVFRIMAVVAAVSVVMAFFYWNGQRDPSKKIKLPDPRSVE